MGKKRVLIVFLALFMLIFPASYGAVISGTIYDSMLNKKYDSVVEITTTPVQRLVAKDGTYSFNVPEGQYIIKAAYSIGGMIYSMDYVNVEVKEDGEYTVDLILFPSTEEEEEILNESDIPVDEDYELEKPPYYALFYILLLAAVIYIIYKSRKKKEKETKTEVIEDDADAVIKFLKKEKGRATQKEIRKNFPQSEAKISLIISDLEDRGVVKKIKKGRGNIIILKK